MNTGLTSLELLRYHRHINLPQVDIDGQQLLCDSRVLIIGVGGLGCAASQYLAASGVGQITLVDDDEISFSNLQRQVLFDTDSVGQSKVAVAADRLRRLNEGCSVKAVAQRLSDDELSSSIADANIVLDCTDNLTSREQINRLCVVHKRPLVSGAAIRFEGQLSVFDVATGSPCYACLSSQFTEPDLSCSEAGVLSPVVGVMGALQATETLKILMQLESHLLGQLLLFDAVTLSFRQFAVQKKPSCSVCGG